MAKSDMVSNSMGMYAVSPPFKRGMLGLSGLSWELWTTHSSKSSSKLFTTYIMAPMFEPPQLLYVHTHVVPTNSNFGCTSNLAFMFSKKTFLISEKIGHHIIMLVVIFPPLQLLERQHMNKKEVSTSNIYNKFK